MTDQPAARREPIRVVVADDHDLYRKGLRLVLEQAGDIEVVGEAGDGDHAVVLAAETAPDVVVLDVRMPRRSGIEACRRLAEVAPSAKVLMLTMSDSEQDLFEAIKAGAAGYILKETSAEDVAQAIVAVHAGQSIIPPSMAALLLGEFAALARGEHAAAPPRLTERELQVLRLVAQGKSNKMIGRALVISENTVKNHVRNILEKLQLHSRMEAAMYAVRERLIDVDR